MFGTRVVRACHPLKVDVPPSRGESRQTRKCSARFRSSGPLRGDFVENSEQIKDCVYCVSRQLPQFEISQVRQFYQIRLNGGEKSL